MKNGLKNSSRPLKVRKTANNGTKGNSPATPNLTNTNTTSITNQAYYTYTHVLQGLLLHLRRPAVRSGNINIGDSSDLFSV